MPKATITLTNVDTGDLVEGRAVFVTIDHASLVDAKRSRADGADLRIRYTGTQHVNAPRALTPWVQNPNTAATRVWFCLREPLLIGDASTDYELSFGDLSAQSMAPVPVRDLSQVQPWTAGSKLLPARSRLQPFLFFDDFVNRTDGDGFRPYVSNEQMDTAIYTSQLTAGSAFVRGPTGVACFLGGPGYLALPSVPTAWDTGAVRVSVEVLLYPGALAGPYGGPLLRCDAAASLNGYAATSALPTLAGLGRFDAGVLTALQYGATADVTSRWVELGVRINGPYVQAILEGVHTGVTTDATYTSGRVGLFAGGTGTFIPIEFRNLRVEKWDGYDYPSATVTLPEAAMPAAPGEIGETLEYSVDVAPGAVRHRALRHQHDTGRLRLSWPYLPPDEWYGLRAFAREQQQGAKAFLWTPPGGTESRYRIRPGSLRTSRAACESPSASLELMKVPT